MTQVTEQDKQFMEMALAEARRSVHEDNRSHPKVGVVVVKNGKVIATAHRGEIILGEETSGNHAEFVALEKKLKDDIVQGATVYTTLEPCTTRNHPKVPCAVRLAERKVRRVVIGMLDPNPDICGRGERGLRAAGIETALFEGDLAAQAEEINRDFTRNYSQLPKRDSSTHPHQRPG